MIEKQVISSLHFLTLQIEIWMIAPIMNNRIINYILINYILMKLRSQESAVMESGILLQNNQILLCK